METKKFTQFGTFSVIMMVPFLVLSLIMIFTMGSEDLILFATFSLVALTMVICLLIFYKLTIYIDNTFVSFKLGIGLISKKYPVENIKSCKAVKNDPLFGIGIRLISNGWLYNVTGLSAVELSFKNTKKIVRIGTNEPEEIAATINRMINSDNTELAADKREKINLLLPGTIIFISVVIPLLIVFSGSRETEVSTTDSGITIKGIYGLTIKYSDIKQLDTLHSLPRIKLRTNGYAFAKKYKGNFRLADQSNAKLFVNCRTPLYINIKTEDLNVYLNFGNPVRTVDLFKTMKTRL